MNAEASGTRHPGLTEAKMTAVDLKLDQLDHVAIIVKDVAQTVDWYQKQFKCTIKYQDKTWALLGFGNIDLAFVVENQHPSHIALKRKDAAQFGTLKTHRDGTKSVYIHDPSGNNIEIMEDQT
jgi:catechol 2,3-dioxygenase-like lactoylglutathione lyase family enzyme